MKVLMIPELHKFASEESGIKRVVEAYHKYAPNYGIEFVDCKMNEEALYDVAIIHAGSSDKYPIHRPLIACLHGLYWTADYEASNWEWKTNGSVVESIRRSTLVTVPSEWVAETIRRDCRIDPVILPHGIDWKDWETDDVVNKGYVLWNKNRIGDVCSPEPLIRLAERMPEVKFLTSFGIRSDNVDVIGLKAHSEMKRLVMEAGVYLSTTKETFGIGVLEAMASGVPVLGFSYGGNLDIVQHGVTGYLAEPGDYDDLTQGLEFCLKHRSVLSENSLVEVKKWGWDKPMGILFNAIKRALDIWTDNQRPLMVELNLHQP